MLNAQTCAEFIKINPLDFFNLSILCKAKNIKKLAKVAKMPQIAIFIPFAKKADAIENAKTKIIKIWQNKSLSKKFNQPGFFQ